jgi:hypothetical protein
MVFDVEEHKANRLRFMAAMYELGRAPERLIGEKAALSPDLVNRISIELLDEKLVDAQMGAQGQGPWLSLNAAGRAMIEQHLYEKSILAKKRKALAWGKNKIAEGTQAAIPAVIKWLVGGIITVIATIFAYAKWKLLSRMLGLR